MGLGVGKEEETPPPTLGRGDGIVEDCAEKWRSELFFGQRHDGNTAVLDRTQQGVRLG